MTSMRAETFSLFCFQLYPHGLTPGGLSIHPIETNKKIGYYEILIMGERREELILKPTLK